MIDASYLRSVVSYEPTTGAFTWRERSGVPAWWNARYAGKATGSLDAYGYLVLRVDRRTYKAHRMAWLYVHGHLPKHLEIDHADCIRTNNAIANLRLADDTQNAANASVRSDNTTGVKGVYWRRRDRKFVAQINMSGKRVCLGCFDTREAAGAAYSAKAAEIYGEFARAA